MCVFRHADLGRLIEEHPSVALRMLQGMNFGKQETHRSFLWPTSKPICPLPIPFCMQVMQKFNLILKGLVWITPKTMT